MPNKSLSYLFFAPLLWTFGIALPVTAAETEFAVHPHVIDIEQAERIILVTYSDKHIDRFPVGIANQSYRRRGQYSSSTWSQRIASSIESEYQLKILSQWPIKEIGEHCVVYLINENQTITEVISALSKDNRVDSVQAMNTFQVMSENRYSDPYYRLQAHIQSLNLADIHDQATGKNVTIAIIDTGVDSNHPDLQGQIRASRDFVSQKSSQTFGDNHGTAIAGVIAAKPNNGRGIVGIAPDSTIISLKACWGIKAGSLDAACNSFTLALAISTAIGMNIDILNLSLTGPHDPLLARLIDKAVQEGIIVIASEADTTDEKSGFPARQQGVIGVRSLSNTTMRSQERSSALSLAAPGEDILTTLPNGAYDFVSGNSLATAHVSGLAALLLQLKRNTNHHELHNLLAQANEPSFFKVFRKTRPKNAFSSRSIPPNHQSS